jgi:uncharacterized protein (DUF302 family)
MEKRCPYGFGRTLSLDFAAAVRKVTRALEARGFTLLSRIDIRDALSRDGSACDPYLIVSACPPMLSPPAFATDRNVGLMVQCQIAIYSEDDEHTTVMVLDGACLMDLLQSPAAISMAIDHREQIETLLESL